MGVKMKMFIEAITKSYVIVDFCWDEFHQRTIITHVLGSKSDES